MSFHEVRFPADISLGVTGGPERRTEVVQLASGREQRNAIWANSRRKYNAGYGVRGPNDLHAVIEFWEARNAKLHGFRWKDWSDFKSCPPQASVTAADQSIAIGNGATASFQLFKTYFSGPASWARAIEKPVSGTVLIQVNSVNKTAGVHFNVDHTTGIVTFTGGNIPPNGHVIRAGFEYDVPVRFDIDHLAVSLAHAKAGAIPDIPIVEIRP